jgi:NDP-sugar pyrophosphorylase family protein
MSSTPNKSRVRLTISLSREVAAQIDNLVDGVKIRNRSHAIETLVSDSMDIFQIKQAVILAGGETAPKKLPAIEKILPLLRDQGILDITLAVGYLGERIKKEIGEGEKFGLKIQYNESDLGTGGALLQLKGKFKKTFLVVNLEQPMNLDLRNLFRFHRENQPLVTIATRSLKDLRGVYVMEPKVFNFIKPGFCMLEEEIFNEIAKQGRLLSYPIS